MESLSVVVAIVVVKIMFRFRRRVISFRPARTRKQDRVKANRAKALR